MNPFLLAAAAATISHAGPSVVHVQRSWLDARRSHYILVEAAWKADAKGPQPVVILSPDVGGNREGYGPFADALANAGYFVLMTTHVSSNCGAVGRRANSYPDMLNREQAAKAIAADPKVGESRDADIAFLLDRMKFANERDDEMKGRALVSDVGVVGIGMGGVTALRVAQKPDTRIKAVAAIAWTPDDWTPLAAGFGAPIPALFLEEGDAAKPEPFDVIEGPTKFLVSTRTPRTWFYSDRDDSCGFPIQFVMEPWASGAVVDFFAAFLRDDAAARGRLDAKSSLKDCGTGCRVEAVDQRGNKR